MDLLSILLKHDNHSNFLVDKFIKKYNYFNLDIVRNEHLSEFLLNEGIIIKIADNGIEKFSVVNGPGLRYTIFTQGCTHNCKGCQNPQTHNFNNSDNYKEIDEIINDLYEIHNVIQGVTLSGGDPLYFKNYPGILRLCEIIKSSSLKDLDIWIYTGFDWNYIKNKKIINYSDVIVDGKFIEELKSYELKFKGSSNQRIIDVKKSVKKDEIVEWIKEN